MTLENTVEMWVPKIAARPRRPTFHDRLAHPVAHGGAVAAAQAVALGLGLACAHDARAADDTIKRAGDHPAYSAEIEPHVLFGWGGAYGPGGYGAGVRVAIPVVLNGFIPKINDSVAISFGIDWVHYDSCWFQGSCTANYFEFPVAMQWNFFVAHRWSVFGEPGAFVYFGSVPDCTLVPASSCPGRPATSGVQPALFLGGRYHLSDNASLTMRIGFPAFSVGLSFFP